MRLTRVIARVLPPVAWCAACHRPFFSDRRRPCRCGETRRLLTRALTDAVASDDRA